LVGSIDLELHLAFVDPVMVSAEDNLKEPTGEEQVALGDPLLAGAARTVNLLCWSATRDDFTVQPESTNDPCISVGTPEKLSAEECKQVRHGVPVTVRCAYRIPVTVRERTEDGKHQLDLGRFRRRLQFTSKVSPEPVAITLVGLVRGDIEVGIGAEKDVVALGSFRRDVGASKDVQLKTDRGDIDLEVESKSLPDFLKAELREEKDIGGLGKVWTLTVTVPPDGFSGDIPRHTYIVLKTKGERPRRLHIPVTGIAYVP
jgi:hypothetical protein